MDSERRPDVDELVGWVRDLTPAERERFLEAACRDSDELRRAVERELERQGVEQTKTQASSRQGESALPPADTFPGYEVIRELRHGGQGVVYQAIQHTTKRKVAIKVLLHGEFASSSARKRFEREIETVAQLHHADIISIFHADVTAAGRPYYVMDYVRGDPLNKHVRQHKLTLRQTLELFARICHAVHYAHQRGVVHRDLKPSNILVDGEGNPKILDFGLAKWLVPGVDSAASMTHAAVGTLQYMAPEQTQNNPDLIDVRADVYALGVILYLLLTGGYPYPVTGTMADVLGHIVHTPPIPPEKNWDRDGGVTSRTGSTSGRGRCPIDREVRTIVLTALAKERERRYQTAAELAGDIERYLADEPIHARGESVAYVLSRRGRALVRRHRVWAYVLVIWAAAFVTDAVVVRAVYSWTPLNAVYERFLLTAFGERDATAFGQVRVVAMTDETDVEQLARDAGVDGVTVENNRSLRRLHGQLMRQLAVGKPLAVAWDISFNGQTEFDEGFVEGVRALDDVGVEVVVGTSDWWADEHGMPRLSENIAPHVRWGSMIAGVRGQGRWGVNLCLQRAGQLAAPSLALQTLAAARRPDAWALWTLDSEAHVVKVSYERPPTVAPRAGSWLGEDDRVELTEVSERKEDNPALHIQRGDRIGMLATPIPATDLLEAATIGYHEVFQADEPQLRDWFAGKVVVVGDMRGATDRHPHPDGRKIAGCHIQATAIDRLLRDVSLRTPGALATPLILLGGGLLGVLAALAGRGVRLRQVGLVLALAVAACAACLVAYRWYEYLCNPLAPIGALILAAWLAVLVQREAHARV